jgi:hypothetical protein
MFGEDADDDESVIAFASLIEEVDAVDVRLEFRMPPECQITTAVRPRPVAFALVIALRLTVFI